jgi:CRP/FNR family cyclic AMP-dependent transcriptional regulator
MRSSRCLAAMLGETPTTDDFKEQFGYLLRTETLNFKTSRVGKHQNVYVCGDQAEAIYFIERGQVKLLMPSPEGNECIVAVYAKGDTFGESCLAIPIPRPETATAMVHTILRRIPCNVFLSHLSRHSLLEKFVQYLVERIAEQQQCIARLMTLDSEHVLGWTILLLAQKLGRPEPPNSRLEHRITHEELSEMVGTTRPRVTEFMRQFRNMGLIEMSPERFLIVNEKKLSDYLARVA